MLDTRNAFEVDVGTFDNALDYRITKFSEFPEVIEQNRADLEGKTVVSFCTGGIRCEKAAIHMKEVGIEHVYQLEGGILKYFEEVGGAHYHGDCFVFDYRTALNPKLEPTATAQCFGCRAVVTLEEQKSPMYVAGKTCPAASPRRRARQAASAAAFFAGRFSQRRNAICASIHDLSRTLRASPTGPLHFGSLVSALASWLDARAHRGAWLVRDRRSTARAPVPGAAQDILATLARLGMHADEPPVWQSTRDRARTAKRFERLKAAGFVYPCGCTRRNRRLAAARACAAHDARLSRHVPQRPARQAGARVAAARAGRRRGCHRLRRSLAGQADAKSRHRSRRFRAATRGRPVGVSTGAS